MIAIESILFAWIYLDGLSRGCMLAWLQERGWNQAEASAASMQYASPETLTRLTFALVVGSAGWVCILVSLVASRRSFRGVRAWLAFMALTSVALAIGSGRSSIYWHGQQRRLTALLPKVSRFVQDLDRGLPVTSERHNVLYPYLCYPTKSAYSIVLLAEPTVPDSPLSMTAMEWTSDGTLRLQLAGAERDAWLEWRKDGQNPSEFVSGLGATFRPVVWAELEKGWYVVRYVSRPRGD